MPRPLLRVVHALLGHPANRVLIHNGRFHTCLVCGKTKDRGKRRMAL